VANEQVIERLRGFTDGSESLDELSGSLPIMPAILEEASSDKSIDAGAGEIISVGLHHARSQRDKSGPGRSGSKRPLEYDSERIEGLLVIRLAFTRFVGGAYAGGALSGP